MATERHVYATVGPFRQTAGRNTTLHMDSCDTHHGQIHSIGLNYPVTASNRRVNSYLFVFQKFQVNFKMPHVCATWSVSIKNGKF